MTREEIDLRCGQCRQAVNAVGCGMPSVRSKACLLAPVTDKAVKEEIYGRAYRSIYLVDQCPLVVCGRKKKSKASRERS